MKHQFGITAIESQLTSGISRLNKVDCQIHFLSLTVMGKKDMVLPHWKAVGLKNSNPEAVRLARARWRQEGSEISDTGALLWGIPSLSCLGVQRALRNIWFELELSQIRYDIVRQLFLHHNIASFASVKSSGLAILSLIIIPWCPLWRKNVKWWCTLPTHCPSQP